MSTLQIGATVRHKRGTGRVERVHRNAFGQITRADVRIAGVLHPRLWVDDLGLMDAAPVPVVVALPQGERPEPPVAA